MKKVFDLYGKYYDLLYKDKDYIYEAEYLKKLINLYKPESKNILDLGCGTGKHIINLAESGFAVTGVELSESMLRKAERNLSERQGLADKVKLVQGDIKSIRLRERFDVIVSLFHVLSYQTSNSDLKLTFKTIKEHLKENGICIFDFWYGPAVLSERPEMRVKFLEDNEIKIYRTADSVMKFNENIVDVNYRVEIKDRDESLLEEIKETHSMRYLFLPEIKFFLNEVNMSLIHFEEWLTGNKLSDKSWYAAAIIGSKV